MYDTLPVPRGQTLSTDIGSTARDIAVIGINGVRHWGQRNWRGLWGLLGFLVTVVVIIVAGGRLADYFDDVLVATIGILVAVVTIVAVVTKHSGAVRTSGDHGRRRGT